MCSSCRPSGNDGRGSPFGRNHQSHRPRGARIPSARAVRAQRAGCCIAHHRHCCVRACSALNRAVFVHRRRRRGPHHTRFQSKAQFRLCNSGCCAITCRCSNSIQHQRDTCPTTPLQLRVAYTGNLAGYSVFSGGSPISRQRSPPKKNWWYGAREDSRPASCGHALHRRRHETGHKGRQRPTSQGPQAHPGTGRLA